MLPRPDIAIIVTTVVCLGFLRRLHLICSLCSFCKRRNGCVLGHGTVIVVRLYTSILARPLPERRVVQYPLAVDIL